MGTQKQKKKKMMKLIVAVLFCFYISCVVSTTSKADAKITSLPGLQYTPNFDQYAGYVTVDNEKDLFYWFVESQNDPANDPVILWLQGGPGCSSIGAGLLQENGPFYPRIINANNQTVGLRENSFSWNKVANMIYLDSPCGVGY